VGFFLRTLIVTFLLFLFAIPTQAKHLHPERYYQEKWCSEMGGAVEVRMDDKTRVDCITNTHAVEVDFAPKWAEAIGQALYYGAKTGMQPGILLIMEDPIKDAKYVHRIQTVIDTYNLGIQIYLIMPEGN
jgi:hypothetical protein